MNPASGGVCPTGGRVVPSLGPRNGPHPHERGYTFAGLGGGTYCVLVDASSLDNAGLLPGQWTFPSTEGNVANYTVTVQEDEQKTAVDFGWHYQLVPRRPDPPAAFRFDQQADQRTIPSLGES